MTAKTDFPKVRYNLAIRERVTAKLGGELMTQQHMRDECDVNRIMAKYNKTGVLTHVNTYAGQYGDFSGVPDYHTGIERVRAAEDMFMSLPAKIRDKFANDPGKFIDFAINPENLAEMRELGLAPPERSAVERPTLGTEERSDPPKADKTPKADPA